jgi:hypothetical protein
MLRTKNSKKKAWLNWSRRYEIPAYLYYPDAAMVVEAFELLLKFGSSKEKGRWKEAGLHVSPPGSSLVDCGVLHCQNLTSASLL